MYHRVEWHTAPPEGIWFVCGCPAGRKRERMGGDYERPCRHVLAVAAAEQDDGLPPRPAGRTDAAMFVDLSEGETGWNRSNWN